MRADSRPATRSGYKVSRPRRARDDATTQLLLFPVKRNERATPIKVGARSTPEHKQNYNAVLIPTSLQYMYIDFCHAKVKSLQFSFNSLLNLCYLKLCSKDNLMCLNFFVFKLCMNR